MRKTIFRLALLSPFLLLLLLLFSSSEVAAQQKIDTAINIITVPADGLLLKQGWKFHSGDNKSWVNPAFNDNSWTGIDPTQLIHYLPEVKQAQICWFRISLDISPSLRNKAFALLIRQYGAAEIYLNGELIRTYGKVSADFVSEQTSKTLGQPLTMQFDAKPRRVRRDDVTVDPLDRRFQDLRMKAAPGLDAFEQEEVGTAGGELDVRGPYNRPGVQVRRDLRVMRFGHPGDLLRFQ